MLRWLLNLLCFGTLSASLCGTVAQADHIIISGGPSLKRWEHYRLEHDRHDRWWGNFIRAATMRMDEIRKDYGTAPAIVWIVYRPSYEMRAQEDGQPYVAMIEEQASKRKAKLVWIRSGKGLIDALNSRPRASVETFDYFGHSNKFSFCLEYGAEIIATCTQWLHERDLPRLRREIFHPDAECRSWGCHTGESMSRAWREVLGVPLIGALGKTDYRALAKGQFPAVDGGWTR